MTIIEGEPLKARLLLRGFTVLILLCEYMETCFHGNQHPWAIKHISISLYFKYQSLKYICLPVMNSPVFPSLDDIYCY